MDVLYESAGLTSTIHQSSAITALCPIALLAQLALLAPPDQRQLNRR